VLCLCAMLIILYFSNIYYFFYYSNMYVLANFCFFFCCWLTVDIIPCHIIIIIYLFPSTFGFKKDVILPETSRKKGVCENKVWRSKYACFFHRHLTHFHIRKFTSRKFFYIGIWTTGCQHSFSRKRVR
jgi:hypothetical protein